MAEIYAGCSLERLPTPAGAKALRFFEYSPTGPLATLSTLAKAAKKLPKDQARALVCPRSTWLTPKGPLRPGPELDAGLDWIKRVADILSARAIVIATGAELTTGERDRSLLAQFVERVRPTGRLIVVAPRGLWEAEHGSEFAAQHNCLYGFDPLEDDAPPGATVYARVRPMGARPRLTDGHLAQIAERLLASRADSAYVAIDAAQAPRDAKRLDKILAEVGADFDPGAFGNDDDEESGDEESDDEESDDEESDGEAGGDVDDEREHLDADEDARDVDPDDA